MTRFFLHPALPVTILLIFITVGIALCAGLSEQNQRQIQGVVENQAQLLAEGLEEDFAEHVQAIRRMADRMATDPAQSEAHWREDARNYLTDFRIYRAIEWIDRDHVIRWVEPVEGNETAIGYDVGFNESRRAELLQAQQSGNIDISGIIQLKQGEPGLVIYAPVGAGEENRGFIAGVFDMESLADSMLKGNLTDHFRVQVISGGKVAWRLNENLPVDEQFSHRVTPRLPVIDWQLVLTPDQNRVEEWSSHWPVITGFSMAVLGLLISAAVLLAQLMLKRNADLLKTRRVLEREIRQRREAQNDLARLESTDALTGLANRRFFMEDLGHSIAMAEQQDHQLALIMIDLDKFQMLNDSLGHHFGDELLIRASERLSTLNSERVMVAYSGGDEFLVCQQNVEDIDDVIHLLGQLQQCFATPFMLRDEPHGITATMGVAVFPGSGTDADTLMRNADIALYRAKEQGRNAYQFYTEGMQDQEVRRLELDKDIAKALANDEFVLFFQPQLDLNDGSIHSVEALIRWQHPERGLLTPGEFIPLAEESGRITDIGRWVVLAACRQLAAWKETPFANLRIALNISGRELDDDRLVENIADVLEFHRIPPEMLEIELTEEIFIDNIQRNLNQLTRLQQLGVHLAIDDFGVGYSSLSYLRNFPVDLLKIDRSFITHVSDRHDDAVITRAVINLAHNLGLQVVAEGVETHEQLDFLARHRCDLIQGYLISRPIPASELETGIRDGSLTRELHLAP
jgi:diguanylate cyclase (GGDEF)-like protein